MHKPRVIIADTDEKYVAPLQLKFVEEFFDQVNLEIVTDGNYFEELFATPQKADILVVSESLYHSNLQRHNIHHTFVMTEQNEKGQLADAAIVRIFKYTSIKVIFNEILGNSGGVLQSSGMHKDCKTILIYSASGGVGKTTLSLGMSLCLTKSYKRVLYINAARLQYFQHMLENRSAITTSDFYSKLAASDDHIYSAIEHAIRREGFHYLPPFKASLLSLGLPYSIYAAIVRSAKASKQYDYIIVDADSTFDEDKAQLLGLVDQVVIVTKQNRSSVQATNLLIGNIDGVNSDKYTFICNEYEREEANALLSPDNRFAVDDYINRIEHCDQMKCEEIARDSGIQRVTFLVV